MAFDFKSMYNKAFAEPATKLNREINKAIGKDVFQDVKTIEEPKVYPPLSSFPAFEEEEPAQWTLHEGKDKTFYLDNNMISVPKNLDTCMSYANMFKESASYYSRRFTYRYNQCVTDYDTLLYYFQDMYLEGLAPMIERASSLLLPFNIFGVSKDNFFDYHFETYHRAVDSYSTMAGIVDARNQQANNLGESVGNSIRLEGGGFGFKGAMKGMAQAGLFNAAVSGFGKYVSNQTRMSDEEKSNIFAKFNKEIFFKEVYEDYINTFLSLIEIASRNGALENISTRTGEEYNTMIDNLNNPMFPQDKVAPLLVQLISRYPFTMGSYEVAKQKYGDSEELKAIIDYFLFEA